MNAGNGIDHPPSSGELELLQNMSNPVCWFWPVSVKSQHLLREAVGQSQGMKIYIYAQKKEPKLKSVRKQQVTVRDGRQKIDWTKTPEYREAVLLKVLRAMKSYGHQDWMAEALKEIGLSI